MTSFTEQPDRSGVVAAIGKMADGFSKLVTHHIALAKLELAEDARVIGTEVGWMAAFVPFLLVGYFLLCIALAVALARWVGLASGFALVGAVNVIGGGAGIYRAAQRLRARSMMDGTVRELSLSASALIGEGPSAQETGNGQQP